MCHECKYNILLSIVGEDLVALGSVGGVDRVVCGGSRLEVCIGKGRVGRRHGLDAIDRGIYGSP